MKKKKWPIIIAVIIILIVAGLGGVFYYKSVYRAEKKQNHHSTIVKKNVKTLDDNSELQPEKVKDNALIYDKKPDYKKGDIIVSGVISAAPDGFIRRVVEIKKSGKKYVVQTELAMLTDVFEEAHITKTFQLGEFDVDETEMNNNEIGQRQSENDAQKVNYTPETIGNYKAVPLASGQNEQSEYLISKSFQYQEDGVSAEGEIGFNAYLQLIIDIDHGDIKFGIAETNESTGKLNMSYQIEKELKDKSKTFYSKSYPNSEFVVAGIPIVITNQLEAVCGASAKGNIDIAVNFDANAKDTIGFLYNSKTGRVEKINKYKRDSTGINWSTEGEAKGESSADVMLHLISKLYGSTGADLGIGVIGKAEGEAKVSAKPELLGFAGKLNLALSPKITGKLVVEKPVIHEKLKEQELFDKDLKAFWSNEWKSSDEWKKDLAWKAPSIKPIEDKEITISKDFDSTYKTRYEYIYKVTCPVFEFSYPSSRWKVTDEEVGNAQDDLIAEKVTISNDRGVEITYWDTNKALGTHAHILQVIKITKVADSSFVPSYPAGTDMDCSSLGNFMVAKLHVIKEMDGEYESDEYKNVDGEIFYAVIPESEVGENEFLAQYGHVDAFSWEYPSNHAFIATSPDGKFSQSEEKDIIGILESFKDANELEE